MKNLLVAQSGGPTAVVNTSLAGVISRAVQEPVVDLVYGAIYGIEGILNDHVAVLNDLDLEILKQTPAAFLGSCRNRLPRMDEKPEVYEKIFSYFAEKNIEYFLYIGGNDSMDTVSKLSDYAALHSINVKIVGVPKTIDNDLTCIDHTPGFGSAAKFVAASVAEIDQDSQAYFLNSVTIIEIMGRHAGWLTAAAGLVRNEHRSAPHLIYLPELSFSNERFILDIKKQFQKGIRNVIVAVSEGVRDDKGALLCEHGISATDSFGHKNLSGVGKILENLVKEQIGCKVRRIELNVCQRCAGHLLSDTDFTEAFAIGEKGVEAALKGKSGEMMIFTRISSDPYEVRIESVDIHKIANQEKTVPIEWIVDGNDISDEFLAYLRPLILGEVAIRYGEDGLPIHLHR